MGSRSATLSFADKTVSLAGPGGADFNSVIATNGRMIGTGAGAVSGKKSYAFVRKATFGAGMSLAALMKCMEGEGMLIKTSDILRSPAEAEEIGRRLHVS